MKDIVFLKRKLNNVPDNEIYEFLNKISDLSLDSVYSLTAADTYFIRKKLGVFDTQLCIRVVFLYQARLASHFYYLFVKTKDKNN